MMYKIATIFLMDVKVFAVWFFYMNFSSSYLYVSEVRLGKKLKLNLLGPFIPCELSFRQKKFQSFEL